MVAGKAISSFSCFRVMPFRHVLIGRKREIQKLKTRIRKVENVKRRKREIAKTQNRKEKTFRVFDIAFSCFQHHDFAKTRNTRNGLKRSPNESA